MSVLIVHLPPGSPGPTSAYRYAQTRDGQTLLTHGSATATTLPATGVGQDVVALVPVRALSWHQVDLPKGTLAGGAARLRAVLEGLLEDRLLDDPQQLHFAVAPQTPAGAPVWVAACDKAWLQAALAPLEAAGRPVSRIVPEFAPLAADGANVADASLHALGELDDAWLVHAHASGVTVLPLVAATVAATLPPPSGLPAPPEGATPPVVLAEPAVAALAEQLFGHKVSLQQAPERWVQAAQSPWDLAQFDLANSGRQRAYKKFSGVWLELLHAPRWRAARWGGVLLVAANLLGLNAWAWKEKTALEQRRSDIRAVLTQTFPQVKVVVDAPIQMTRELVQLRQTAGAASRQDLENLLTAVGSTLPPQTGLDLNALDFADGELRLKGPSVKDGKAQQLAGTLEARGYTLRNDGDSLLLKADRPPEASR